MFNSNGKPIYLTATLVVSWLLYITPSVAGEAIVATSTLKGHVSIKTWKALRDDRIVKQDLDYSCGAASVATILNEFYGRNVTELELLEAIGIEAAASLENLAQIIRPYGFKGVGVALNFERLKMLKVPAIVYLKHRSNDHFSVIRGISENGTVWLADPSLGNRKLRQDQFLAMWETRHDNDLKGKILLILPLQANQQAMDASFFTAPVQNTLPNLLLSMRTFR